MNDNAIKLAIKEAEDGVKNKDGGPFGAAIVDMDGNIISLGHNKVLSTNDPTNHAEIVAIREACKKLNTQDLTGYKIYSTCEPCPMCLSAIIWSNIKEISYSSTREDAEKIGFKDKMIYDYLSGNNDLLKKVKVDNKDCDNLMENYQGELY